jgi:hypothetical protein
MATRGWAIPASEAKDEGTTVAFLNQFRMKPLPRPEGFVSFAQACLRADNPILREAALWSLPRPLAEELNPVVEPLLSDSDAGVQRAARHAANRHETFTPEKMAAERQRIVDQYKSDPKRMMEELNSLMLRFMDASAAQKPNR